MDQQDSGGGFVRRNRNLVPLGAVLRESEDASTRKVALLSELKKLWVQLAGERLAFISFPYRLRDGVLCIAVRDAIWISELPYLKDEILARFAPLHNGVKDIRFTLAKTAPPKGKPPVAHRELTQDELDWIERLSALIGDKGQRESFCAALKSYRTLKRP